MNLRKRIMKTLPISTVILVVSGVLSVANAGDPLADAAQGDTARQAPGSIQEVEILDMGGGVCEDWVADRGWEAGNNQKEDGTRFFVAVGAGIIQPPSGHPNYINARQDAYVKAFLKAKASLVSYMTMSIQNDLTLASKEGTFSDQPVQTSENSQPKAAKPEKEGWEVAYAKTKRLLNAELDKQLKERGVNPNPEPTEEERLAAETAAREIMLSEEFRQLIRSTSKAQLKGVRRMFVNESVKPGEQGEICVVALGSPKTMAMADAIMTGNPDIAPTGFFGTPLSEQIPNKRSQDGIKELMTSYGVQMSRDDVGEFHLISYAQSGTKSKSKLAMSNAKTRATQRAAAALASFAGEHAAVTTRTENSETAKEFADSMGEIEYDENSALEEVIKSSTPMVNLAGGRVRESWAAKHPVTGQIIVGVVYVWSAGSQKAAKQLKRETTKTARPVGTSSNQGTLNTGKGFQGSASKGSSNSDF